MREISNRFHSNLLVLFYAFLVLASAVTEVSYAQTKSEALLQAGPFAVGSQSFELTDSTRPTLPRDKSKAQPGRLLKTTLWYPATPRGFEWLRRGPTPTAANQGPFPLLIYSHGFMSNHKGALYLVEHLASLGYVVAAPDFPLTNYSTPGGAQAEDVVNQPGDVSFLIDTLLAWNADPNNGFHALIDPTRVGLVGLSLGGMTTELTAFHPKLRDPRIRVAVSIAGPTDMFADSFFQKFQLPFLMLAGTSDVLVGYEINARDFPERAPTSALVTLVEGSHTGFAQFADPFLSWLDNPDWIGCRAIHGNVSAIPNFLEELGGPEEGILTDRRSMPCQTEPLPHALQPKRQHELTILAVTSFLQSHFATTEAQRAQMRRYLLETFPAENPEVRVKPGRAY